MFSRGNNRSSSEFSDFDIFADIHRYFRDKYLADRYRIFGHEDFYDRTEHFFKLLIWLVKKEGEKPPFYGYSISYIKHCNDLFTKEITAEHVSSYMILAAQKAGNASKYERIFYQRFLAKEALVLLSSDVLNEGQVSQIKNSMPADFLSNEQSRNKKHREVSVIDCTASFIGKKTKTSVTIDFGLVDQRNNL